MYYVDYDVCRSKIIHILPGEIKFNCRNAFKGDCSKLNMYVVTSRTTIRNITQRSRTIKIIEEIRNNTQIKN